MNDCVFCEGKPISAEYVRGDIKPTKLMLKMLLGFEDEESEQCEDGIQLKNGNRLYFDNSSGEYALQGIEIKHCPFCGKLLMADE